MRAVINIIHRMITRITFVAFSRHFLKQGRLITFSKMKESINTGLSLTTKKVNDKGKKLFTKIMTKTTLTNKYLEEKKVNGSVKNTEENKGEVYVDPRENKVYKTYIESSNSKDIVPYRYCSG